MRTREQHNRLATGSKIMLAVSTSWKSTTCNDGTELLQAMERLPVAGLELDYRITAAMFQQIRTALRTSELRVVSIHNFFPVPPIVPRRSANGDLFLLSHPDKEERLRAVQWTERTLECADDLETGIVILHCGRIDMNPELEVLYQYLDQGNIAGDEAQAFIHRKLAERQRVRAPYLDALLLSLDRLLNAAGKRAIRLALENRNLYHELPGPEEFDVIFREFDGGPLGYWHDTGHAQVSQELTLTGQETLLKQYGERLLGMHLHDARGHRDHLVPGTGAVDFALIQSSLPADRPCVLELQPGSSEQEVLEGIAFLREQGFG